MTDIYCGLALIAVIYAGVIAITVALARRYRKLIPYAGVLTIVFVFFSIRMHDSIALSHLLPFSNLIVIGDWVPFGAAALTGLMLSSPLPPQRNRVVARYVLVVLLNLTWIYYSYGSFFLPPPPLRNQWKSGVCLQSSTETCGPAAAATLLAEHGIPTTEAEMAKLCLSSRSGTTLYGLFRGLKLKTQNTPWDVEIVALKIDDLRKENALPALIVAELIDAKSADPRYSRDWGWVEGVPHAVVIFRIGDKRVEIGDPAIGRERWLLESLNVLWHGVAVRLVPRVKK